MEKRTVRINGTNVHLLGICQGLAGEADSACKVIEDRQPDVVALALDPDLAPRFGELSPEGALDARDQAYRDGLSRFGDVDLPSPAYRDAITVADEIGARVEGVDLSEDEYMDRYLEEIGMFELAKRALKLRWMNVRPLSADGPAEFCRAFDESLNSGPFAELETRREEQMAQSLASLAETDSIVHLVEIERLDGLTRRLKARVRDRAPRT